MPSATPYQTDPRSASRHRTLVQTSLLFALCSPTVLLAQEKAEDKAESKAVVLDTVTVTEAVEKPYTVDSTPAATKLPLSLRETPQSVTVITQQRLQDQNLQSMRDVLDQTPGVYSYSYDSERVVFTSRGFVIDSTLYDGVPVAPGLNADSTDPTLDTALYERIEIVRGATGLLTGAGNPSAAVNLVRKHAQGNTLNGSLSLSYASWDDFRSVADVTTPLTPDGRIRARVVGVYQNRESYMDLYKNEKQVFYGVVDADLTSKTRVSAGYDYQQTLPQSNTWGSFPLFFGDGSPTDWRRSITTATKWSYWNNKTQTGFAELEHHFDGDWLLRSTVQRRETDGYSNLFYVYGFPDQQTGEGLIPFAYRSIDHGRQNSVDAYLSGPFQLFGRQHELVLGGTSSSLRNDSYEFQHGDMAEVGNFFDWDGNYPEPEFSDVGDYVKRVRNRESAAYAALRLSLADALKLIAGARYSHLKSDHFYIYDDADEPFVQNYDKFTPYAGLIYDLSSQWSAFTSYTKIFNPQYARTITEHYLAPRDGYSTEIGIKGAHFGGRFNTALTLFDTRQDNVAVPDPTIPEDPNPNRSYFMEEDGTRTRGFELELAGEPIKNWNVSLGWSYYSMKNGDGDKIKTYIPRTLIRSTTRYDFTGGLQNLSLGGGVNWQSRSHLDAENPTSESGLGRIKQGTVTLLSLMARYKLTPQFSIQANAENLLDEKYYVIDEYANIAYGDPVNASLTLRYDF